MEAPDRARVSATQQRVITVKTAAQLLSVSRSHVYKLMDSGQLPYVKLNRARRIEVAAIDRLIAAARVSR